MKITEFRSQEQIDAAWKRLWVRRKQAFKPRMTEQTRFQLCLDFVDGEDITKLAKKYDLTDAGVRYLLVRRLLRERS